MPILLNRRPFCRLVLGEAVEVNSVHANCKSQEGQQEHDSSFPMLDKATVMKLIQHKSSDVSTSF